MILKLTVLGVFLFDYIQCKESENSEGNRIEVSPFYETIIFSDIADIINDLQNNKQPFETLASSNKEKAENIEDLLFEYQHYLDRAHKQRLNYFEKTKSNIPTFQHDGHNKLKPFQSQGKYDNFYYTNSYVMPNPFKLSQQSYNNPLDLLIPYGSKERITKSIATTSMPGTNNNGELLFLNEGNEKKVIDFEPVFQKSASLPSKMPCYCKKNQISCDCNCKQCMVTFDKFLENRDNRRKESYDDEKKNFTHNVIPPNFTFNNAYHSPDNRIKDKLENFNIQIKVDIQIPKLRAFNNIYNDKEMDSGNGSSREILSTVNLPYFNFPVMEMYGHKKSSNFIEQDNSPLHKITIHKKKKSRVSNINKKHKKKLIPFHNIKVEPHQYLPIIKSFNDTNQLDNLQLNVTEMLVPKVNGSNFFNETQKHDTTYLTVNITNKANNDTQEDHKNNSIETDFSKLFSNLTTTEKAIILRRRRNTVNDSSINILDKPIENNNLIESTNLTTTKMGQKKKISTKMEKDLLTDAEMLYWPKSEENKPFRQLKNITYRILESENKKDNLIMSKETVLKNHTISLAQAIFAKAEWNDVDTIVSDFVAFVGKYITGVLTFCSQTVCHSIKCVEKTCVYRICTPEERFNNKGHCSGSNITDNVTSLESLMDLPSDIGFEIVDILQEKMLGKLYGKMTLCITKKCITFAACKKKFVKSRCNTKELNSVGQCQINDMKLL